MSAIKTYWLKKRTLFEIYLKKKEDFTNLDTWNLNIHIHNCSCWRFKLFPRHINISRPFSDKD